MASFKLDKVAVQKAMKVRASAKDKIFKDVSDEREERKLAKREAKEKERTEKLEKMSFEAREKFLKKEEDRVRKRRMKKNGGRIMISG